MTDVWISIYGSNVNVDQNDNVLTITTTGAQSILRVNGAQNGPRR